MQYETLDYRNGKYQGSFNQHGQRHGVGIFIDDDLTFYLSDWRHNKLNGPSLLYISHGKYIYGEWNNNELSGLAIFRFGDTVIIGNFQNSFPRSKCLIIFQRFNFACLFEQKKSNWNIVESGNLNSHKMLVSFIKKVGVTVPDHYYSLTKFLSNFTLSNNHLKTFPCSIGCCYFGFLNGLGMVFNSNNGLVSIGKHTMDKLTQFGGRFDSHKSGCEGNFEPCGQKIPYVGQRPIHQIYPIYNRLHKRSLNFVNQYFDSNIKNFQDVEEFLKNQIKIISEQCKSTRFNIGDLNESLDYQQYTEQQSLKINSIRDFLYSPTNNSLKEPIIESTPIEYSRKLSNFRNIEENQKEQILSNKFFRNETGRFKQAPCTQQNKEIEIFQQQTPQLNLENTQIQALEVYPSRKQKNLIHKQEIQTKSKMPISPTVHNNLAQLSNQNNCKTNQSDQIKTKQKMRSNNLRYIQNEITNKEEKIKVHSQTKRNNVYLQNYKKQNQQSPENYKVPTFKGLMEQVESIKQTKRQTAKIQKYQSPQKTKVTINNQYHNKSNIKKEKNTIYQPLNANYQEIEQRRKRILKQYKNINQQVKKNVYSPKNAGMHLKYDTPTQGFAFSLNREDEQGSFGMVPLSITPKKEDSPSKINYFKRNDTYLNSLKQPKPQPQPKSQKNQKPYNISYKTYLNENHDMKCVQTDKNNDSYNPQKYSNDHGKSYDDLRKQNINEIIQPPNKTTNWNQSQSPSRLKLRKNYQYLYQ